MSDIDKLSAPPTVNPSTTVNEIARTLRTVAQGWPVGSITSGRLYELVTVLQVIGVHHPTMTLIELMLKAKQVQHD